MAIDDAVEKARREVELGLLRRFDSVFLAKTVRRSTTRNAESGGKREASQALTSEDKILLPTSISQGKRHSWGKPSMAFASWI